MLYRIKNIRKKITEKYGHKEEQTKLISHSWKSYFRSYQTL